jgi:hypothetical protein
MLETANVHTNIRVRRWDQDQAAFVKQTVGRDPLAGDFFCMGMKPYLTTIHEDANLITNAGWAALLGGVAGSTIGTKFSAAAGRIGVGTGTGPATAFDTHLSGDTGSGSTTSYYQLVSGAPVINTASVPATLTFQATYGTTVANFAWEEFGIDNYSASSVTTIGTSSVFFNHGISNQGAKVSGQVWEMTVTVNCGFPNGSTVD